MGDLSALVVDKQQKYFRRFYVQTLSEDGKVGCVIALLDATPALLHQPIQRSCLANASRRSGAEPLQYALGHVFVAQSLDDAHAAATLSPRALCALMAQ